MRLIKQLLLSFLVLLGGSTVLSVRAHGAETVSIRGILVIASDKAGASDGRLAQYEPTLRKLLRFESYRSAGEGSASLGVPGSGTISLGGGHRIEITTEDAGGGQIRERVRWLNGDHVLQNTVIVVKRGSPVVLGGPATGKPGEVYAIIVITS